MVAGGVHEANPKTNGQVVVGDAVSKRLRSNGHVKVAAHVSAKCATTNRDVISAVSITRKRIFTHRGIINPGGEVKQSAIALSGVAAGIAAIRCRGWEKCLRSWRKRQAGEHQRDEKYWNCFFKLNQSVHGFCFLFPRRI
jgi:hypothetical protein